MKYKVIALLLALTMMSWAQSASTSQAPASNQKSENVADQKATPCCCDTMSAEHKDGQSCMRDHAKGCCSGKKAASCCKDKEAKACIKGDKTAACCASGKCGKDKEMSCCSTKKDQKARCCDEMQCGKNSHTHHVS